MTVNARHELGCASDAVYRACISLQRLLTELEFRSALDVHVRLARQAQAHAIALHAEIADLRSTIEDAGA